MADNEFLGSALYATWISASPAGTVVLNTDYRSLTYTPSIDFVDATAGADTAKRRINSFKDGAVKYSGLLQYDIGTAMINLLTEGVAGTLTIAPSGTAAGRQKLTVPAICMGMTLNLVYNDVAQIDVSWQQNGAATGTVY